MTLSNGYVLCFNLYTNALTKTQASSEQTTETTRLQVVRLSQVFKSGNIVESVSMPDPDVVLLTSDSQSHLISVDTSAKSGNFNDLLVVPLRQRATQMLLVKDESDPENRSYALSVGDAESDRAGDVCQ